MSGRISASHPAGAGAIAGEIAAALQALPHRATQPVRALRRNFSRRLAKAPPEEIIRIASQLTAGGDSLHRFVAAELILHHRAALESLDARLLARLGRGIHSWDTVDTFALYLAGPAWRARQVADRVIHSWAHSPDRWWRRAALVSTVALNSKARGGGGDAPRTLRVCRILLADPDDMVVKALSWALRELAKRDPRAARRFLTRYKAQLAARVLREVGNKLTIGLKYPRRA